MKVSYSATSAIPAFLSWCDHQGIKAPRLNLQERADGYRYMEAEEAFGADNFNELVVLPLQACLTGNSLDEVADRLLFEKNLGKDSQWSPYLDVLPSLEDLGTIPLLWDDERIDSIKDGGQVKRMVSSMSFDGKDPWTMACVHSRSNFLADGSYCLAPLLDMLNHDGTVATRAKVVVNKLDEDDKVLSLQTKASVEASEEVSISYGKLSNSETFCRYGFVETSNPHNTEDLIIPIINREPIMVTVYSDGSIDAACKASLRLDMASADELEKIQGNPLEALKPISDRNELDVTSFMATYIQEAVDAAQEGASATIDDGLISTYQSERAALLQTSLKRIEQQFPDIEY